jgi:hypothetical protein
MGIFHFKVKGESKGEDEGCNDPVRGHTRLLDKVQEMDHYRHYPDPGWTGDHDGSQK